MKEIIEKLLTEVDTDIKELMLKEAVSSGETYKYYQLLPDPANTILMWQELRDRKNKHD